MPYQLNAKRSDRKTRKIINLHQNKFPLAYVSTIDNSRRPQTSLSDMTNLELVQDNVFRPRPPLNRYGTQPAFPVVGRGKFRYNGSRGLIWLFNVAGTGKLYYQIDGGTFTAVSHTNTYNINAWTQFGQSKGKLYPFNGLDNLNYIDLSDWSTHVYTALGTPSVTGLIASTNLTSGGTPYTYYYRVSVNNEVGESIASSYGSIAVHDDRGKWSATAAIAKTVDVTWTIPAGGTSSTVYVGDKSDAIYELITLGNGVTKYTDDGSLQINPYKKAPDGNSTQGFIPTWLYNDAKNSQIFGVDTANKLYYSAAGTADFSPYAGGGWVTIDENGDTVLNFVDGFRDGKGEPVITTSSRGAAGKGLLNHVTFATLNVGSQIITYPNVYPASGQSGTYAPRATVKARDAFYYFTGQDVRTTGTSQNIINILTTQTISQAIEPDVANINLAALSGAVGIEYKDRLYFALPVGSSTNNELWYCDLSRKSAWILRCPLNITDMWLYEDSSGMTHFCVLINNVVLEFSRAGVQTHQDDGVAWNSRAAFQSLVWDEDGITLGQVRNQYFKFLQPKGQIKVNATGLTRKGVNQAAGSDSFTVTTSPTGIGQWDYSGDYKYGDDVGAITNYGKALSVLQVRPKGLLAQLDWEVIGSTSGTDYIFSSCNTRGFSDETLVYKG